MDAPYEQILFFLKADFAYNDGAYDEDEGETSTYYLPGAFEVNKSSKFTQKKRKHSMKLYAGRPYEVGVEVPYGHGIMGSQQSSLIAKRPTSNLNVGSIPTKRIRTASRQRVISPFNATPTGSLQAPTKTDASSGDTNSFQDELSTLHGGLQIQKSVEVESVADFERQLTYDSAETSAKHRKKKKAKHMVHDFYIKIGWIHIMVIFISIVVTDGGCLIFIWCRVLHTSKIGS